jgi:uncharacterized repeat protein (TIGR03803 family)
VKNAAEPDRLEMKVMKEKNFSSQNLLAVVAAFLAMLMVVSASAQEKIIFHFDTTTGTQPSNSLISDGKGNLYGVTATGGNPSCNFRGCGLVFELSPGTGNLWTEKILYSFVGGSSDGAIPLTDLIFDSKGNLYGATANPSSVYELTPNANGTWTEKVLYLFPNQEGYDPGSRLALDSKGNVYGTLTRGGFNSGEVFELIPQSNGTWKESVLYGFTGSNGDGNSPYGGVVLDAKGNIYGTTEKGGTSNYGTVYKLTPNGSGGFSETIIYNFTQQGDGGFPLAPLTISAAGNLYGTTLLGGVNNMSTVFELSPSGAAWKETVLYNFGSPPDGSRPSGVVFDAQGNLWGTTQNGGSGCNTPGCGTVFKLKPQSSGFWKETIFHQFESADDGSQSLGNVLVDAATGHVYGTTQYGGGRYGYGTIFQVGP